MSIAKPIQWSGYNHNHPIADGLVRLYPAWAQTGPTAFELVNGEDGTLEGATWEGEGWGFDGNNQIITFSDVALGLFHTVSSWLRFDNIVSRIPISHGVEESYPISSIANLWIYTAQGTSINFSHVFDTDLHLYTVTRNSHLTTFYIDGAQVGQESFGGTNPTMTLGRFGNFTGDSLDFIGAMNQTSFWTRVLDVSEITELAAKPYLLLQPPPTKVYFYFQAPVVSGVTGGILHRGQMPGILSRVA